MLTRELNLVLLTFLVLQTNFASGEIIFKKGAPHVTLSNNAELSGSIDYSREGRPFSSFIGIPFGTIPGRFEAALPTPAWDGVLVATKEGEMCVQGFQTEDKVLTFGSEDCLNLNVYVPMNNTQKKGGFPVMVWIHGGGFAVDKGFGYGPKFFLDEDIILVTINYRLGAFGFVSTGDSVIPGNNGLKDQVLALKWVQKNIRNFGGDPGKVTIFGESAGGASVHYLMLSPTTNGLFKYAISQSGSALAPWAYNPNPRETAVKLATHLKCSTGAGSPSQISSEEIRTCLKAVTAQDVNEAMHNYAKRWPSVAIPVDFVPVKEPKSPPSPFLTDSPWDIVMDNSSSGHGNIPWIVGATEDEGAGLYAGYILQDQKLVNEINSNWEDVVLKTIYMDRFLHSPEERTIVAEKIRKFCFGDEPISTEMRDNLTNLYSDSWFLYSVREAAVQTAFKGGKSPVYLFQYAYQGPASAMNLFGIPMGEEDLKKVGHADDLILQFNLDGMLPEAVGIVKTDSEHEQFSKNFVKLWTSFAIHGKPSHTWGSGKGWRPISNPKQKKDVFPLKWYRLNSNPSYIDDAQFKQRMSFWDQLYKDHILSKILHEKSGTSPEEGTNKTEL